MHVIGIGVPGRGDDELHPDLREGDAFLHNDPYLGNTHSADHAILVPVFIEGEHVFTAVRQGPPGRLRQRAADDLRAAAPRTSTRRARSTSRASGPARLSTDVDDVIRMCRRRIRVPEQWYGDYLATLGAARIAERRLKELCAPVRARDDPGASSASGSTTASAAWRTRSRSSRAARWSAARRTIPYPGLPDGIPLKVDGADRSPRRDVIELDLRDNPDNYPGGLNESRACATTNVDDRASSTRSTRTSRTTRAASGASRVHLREGCIAGIPRFPHSCSMATTNVADRLVCITQAAFADLGEGFGLAEGAMGIGPSCAVVSGRRPRLGGAPYVNQIFLGVDRRARLARRPTAGRPTSSPSARR